MIGSRDRVRECIEAMNAAGIKTSLFIDPDEAQIELGAQLGAPWVELHTGAYATAYQVRDACGKLRVVAGKRHGPAY